MPLTRTCRISGKEFVITDHEITLLDKLSPVIGGEKFSLPIPDISPEERRRRRLPYKNYFSLFKREDRETGEKFISTFPPDSPYTIYSQPRWWSDSWDAMDYATEYNPTLPIAEQIHDLQLRVPMPALDNAYRDLENSEYINGCGPSKDCYLTSNSAYNEKCLYGWFVFNSVNILDSNYVRYSEYCCNSQHIWKCYNVHFAWDSSECRDSRYIFSCEGCKYILGGVRLSNQSYQILNVPCTQGDYEQTLEKLKTVPEYRIDFEQKVKVLISKVGLEKNIHTGSVDSMGDFCYDSKNAYECYNVGNCENVAHITDSYNIRDSADISMWGDETTLSYDSIDIGQNVSNIYFSIACWGGAHYNLYSYKCNACSYIFGCSGLRNKSYCIFNKQYSKEEWEITVKKIIRQMQAEGSWGEFLGPKYAFYAYNESHAMDMMPLSREAALALGYRSSDREEVEPEGITKVIPGERLPDDISKIPDDILHWAIRCPRTAKYFQIQPLELDLHRRFSIPIPQIHPIERIKMRLGWDKRVFDFDF